MQFSFHTAYAKPRVREIFPVAGVQIFPRTTVFLVAVSHFHQTLITKKLHTSNSLLETTQFRSSLADARFKRTPRKFRRLLSSPNSQG